jgi:hypothetical protein
MLCQSLVALSERTGLDAALIVRRHRTILSSQMIAVISMQQSWSTLPSLRTGGAIDTVVQSGADRACRS